MAESNKTQIRQADNSVKIEGLLRELRIEEKDDVISGDVIIATDAHSEHAVRVYATRLTRDSKPNTAYKGLQTLIAECKETSIAALMKEGRTLDEAHAMATKIRIGGRTGGQLGRNEFYVGEEFVSRPSVSANYFHRIIDNSFEPKAVFDVEVYIEKMRKEIKDGEETGRLLIDAIIPAYNGVVIPMEFVAEGEIADYLEANYEPRKTSSLSGEIINIAERVITKKASFGKERENVEVNFTRELRITGGDPEQYDAENPRAYSTEQIQAAWRVRESETLPALLKKAQGKDTGKNKKNEKAPGFKF